MISLRFLLTKVILIVILQILSYAKFLSSLNSAQLTNEARPNFTILAEKYGYRSDQYEIVTEDGYILTLLRIPGRSKFPVLVMHGIFDSVDSWLLRGEKSLPITLARNGYDVWCANSRGNRYSRRHLFLNPDENADFWSYSFHEVGYYDLPAIIDHILLVTSAPSVSAIAHSQGNTAFYVLGSTRPDYNKKVNVMISLAPVCYLHNTIPPISTFIKIAPIIQKLFSLLNVNEILGDTSTLTQILRKVCPSPIGYVLCAIGILFPLTGYDAKELEPKFYRSTIFYFPSGSSSKSLAHYLQVGNRRTFAQFDYGPDRNIAFYNATTPPPYDLDKVSMPIALLAGRNDHLSRLQDVELLKAQLPNIVYYLVNPYPKLNHADYIWGRRMHGYLFPYILRLLGEYNYV